MGGNNTVCQDCFDFFKFCTIILDFVDCVCRVCRIDMALHCPLCYCNTCVGSLGRTFVSTYQGRLLVLSRNDESTRSVVVLDVRLLERTAQREEGRPHISLSAVAVQRTGSRTCPTVKSSSEDKQPILYKPVAMIRNPNILRIQ